MPVTESGAPARRQWPALSAGTGALSAAWWAYPWIHPRGAYAGHYRYTDIELGVLLTLIWLAVAATALCPPARRRAFGMRLGVSLSALILTAIVGDAGCTLWSAYVAHVWNGRDYYALRVNELDPELHWKHRPSIAWRGQKAPDCDPIDFRTDEHGFRNPTGVTKADLVFVGDSVTEAGEVPEEATFVRLAAERLGQSAVNLGVFSYGPQQELAVLKRYGLAYRPRTVVWQVTEWNDLEDAEAYGRWRPSRRPSLSWAALHERFSPVAPLISACFPPRRRFDVEFQGSDGTIERRMIWPYHNPVAAHRQGLEVLRQTLAEAAVLCRERDIGLVVLFVPSHTRILAPYVIAGGPEQAARYQPAGGLDPTDGFGPALAEVCRALGCTFVDVTAELRRRAKQDNRQVYVRNDTHLGRDGHDEVARMLADRLGRGELARVGGDATRRR
jgi:hypothetical protein